MQINRLLKIHDKESGLHYNRHRYYDPLQGRYITQDPIGLEGGVKTYTYPLNPIQGRDAGISLDVFSGGSAAIGLSIGTNDKASGNKDICTYYAQCDHSGVGLAMGIAASLSVSESSVSAGQADSKGAMMGGDLLGKFSIAGTRDDSGNRTGILSMGPGAGAWVGELSNCSQYSKCLSELLG